MYKLRYPLLAPLILIVGVGVWAAMRVGGAEEAQTTSDVTQVAETPCGECSVEKAVIPDDAKQRQLVFERLKQEQRGRQAKYAEQNRRRVQQWRGCKFVPAAKPEDKDEFERQRRVGELFTAKQAIPQARTDKFQWVLSHPESLCVGWNAKVSKVRDAEGARIIELVVSPALVTKGGGLLFTTYKCRETWKLDGENNLIFERIEDEPGAMRLLFSP